MSRSLLGKEERIKGQSFNEDNVPRIVTGRARVVREYQNLCPHKAYENQIGLSVWKAH